MSFKSPRLGLLTIGILTFLIHPGAGGLSVTPAQEWSTKKVLIIDPGHGGKDPGAVGPSGLTEKNVTLSIAQKIKERLSETLEVYLTRDGDYLVDLERRTEFANHHRGDVFVSVHASGAFGQSSRGVMTFHYGPGEGSEPLPRQEGGESWETDEGPPLWDDLWIKHGGGNRTLADLVHGFVVDKSGFKDMGIRQAPILVLRGVDMPAILVEIGHLTHPGEEAALRKPETISLLAEAISLGIEAYLGMAEQ